MLTKKDIIKIILAVLIGVLVAVGIVWLIIEVAPILIGALVFISWLGAALADGAKQRIKIFLTRTQGNRIKMAKKSIIGSRQA